MFSLLALVTTVLVLGSALLWRAVRSLPLARAGSVALWRSAILNINAARAAIAARRISSRRR